MAMSVAVVLRSKRNDVRASPALNANAPRCERFPKCA